VGSRRLKEVRAGRPHEIHGATIVPLEEWDVVVRVIGRRILAHGGKRAVGVVIRERGNTRAFDLFGDPLDLEELRGRVIGLHLR
jgi:hypothetical protein